MEARSFSRGALSGHILGCHGHVPLQFLDLQRWQANPFSTQESLDAGAELGSPLALGRRGARPLLRLVAELRLLAELLRLLAEPQLSPNQIRPRALRMWARGNARELSGTVAGEEDWTGFPSLAARCWHGGGTCRRQLDRA